MDCKCCICKHFVNSYYRNDTNLLENNGCAYQTIEHNISGYNEEEDNSGDDKEEDLLVPIHEEVVYGIFNTSNHTCFGNFLIGQVNNEEEHNQLEADYFDGFITRSGNIDMGMNTNMKNNWIKILLSRLIMLVVLL